MTDAEKLELEAWLNEKCVCGSPRRDHTSGGTWHEFMTASMIAVRDKEREDAIKKRMDEVRNNPEMIGKTVFLSEEFHEGGVHFGNDCGGGFGKTWHKKLEDCRWDRPVFRVMVIEQVPPEEVFKAMPE